MTHKKVFRGKPQPTLKFVDLRSNQILDDIWDLLENGLWETYLFDVTMENIKSKAPVESQKPVFPYILPLQPGFTWNPNTKKIEAIRYTPQIIKATKNTFEKTAESYFHSFGNKRIGVHLSGGLDSSLIICLLKKFKIPFVAIGFKSNRFEFRTERRIQEILLDFAEKGELLDLDEFPFYSGLDKIEKHQVPHDNIKMNQANNALAETFEKYGVQVVFTGQGGDSLLVDPPSQVSDFNIGDEFIFPWEQDFVYGGRNIELRSFFADKNIIDQLYNLRYNSPLDPLKKWARSFFSDILPKELSQFCYCGDFFGHSMSGLENAKPMIKHLFEESYDLTHHHLFSPTSTDRLIKTNVFDFDYNSYIEFCTKISMAVWLHSLFRNDEQK